MPSPPFHWPIFVVSLEIATQRRSEIAAQLQDAGLAFSFVDAIDGRTTLPAEWESRIDRDGAARHYGYPMSDSEFACALSHQLVYARILEEGLPGAVVLEDDAILTSEFAAFYRSGLLSERPISSSSSASPRGSTGAPGARYYPPFGWPGWPRTPS